MGYTGRDHIGLLLASPLPGRRHIKVLGDPLLTAARLPAAEGSLGTQGLRLRR